MPQNAVPFDFFNNPQLDFSGMTLRNGETQMANASSAPTSPYPGQPTPKQSAPNDVRLLPYKSTDFYRQSEMRNNRLTPGPATSGSDDPFDPAIFNNRYHSGE